MWFKNLYLYRLPAEFTLNVDELEDQLAGLRFQGCTSEQHESTGWVSPFGRDAESLMLVSNGYILVRMAHQERILPSSVVKEELEERVQVLEEQESRKVGTREKKTLREQVEFELLPRAFTRTRQLDAWIDTQNGWMVVNTASANQAERLTALLRKTIGSLPVTIWTAGNKLPVLMTQWIKDNQAPTPFLLGDECELRATGEAGAVAAFKKHELNTEEVMSNLNAGKVATKLMLTWADKMSFVLTDTLQVKRVKFLDLLSERLDEQEAQTQAEELDIEFAIMSGEVSLLLADLAQCLSTENQVSTTTETIITA
jgi:recombination associated protein RdgC